MAKDFNLHNPFEYDDWKLFCIEVCDEKFYVAAKTMLDALTMFLGEVGQEYDEEELGIDAVSYAAIAKLEFREETDDRNEPWRTQTFRDGLVEAVKEIDPGIKAFHLCSTVY